MQIVANSMILKRFKSIDIFKIDLGSNFRGPVSDKPDPEIKFKIKDEFIKKYQTVNGKLIHKYGDIGSLKFYEDLTLSGNEIHVYKDESIYEIEMTNDDYKREPKEYLGSIIQAIDMGDKKLMQELVSQKIFTNMPESVDRPDMSLPKDQYLEALKERRKKINELNNVDTR